MPNDWRLVRTDRFVAGRGFGLVLSHRILLHILVQAFPAIRDAEALPPRTMQIFSAAASIHQAKNPCGMDLP
jgi:hypothetical protein